MSETGKVSSCFKNNITTDAPVFNNKSEWKYRLSLLKKTIDKYLKEVPKKWVISENLFFDI
jgi:hypothetical protein